MKPKKFNKVKITLTNLKNWNVKLAGRIRLSRVHHRPRCRTPHCRRATDVDVRKQLSIADEVVTCHRGRMWGGVP